MQNFLIGIARSFLTNGLVRARVLQLSRVASAALSGWVLTSVYVFITTHLKFIDAHDAAYLAGVLATCAGGLVLGIVSVIYSWADPKKVSQEIASAKADAASTVANGIASGQTTPQQIQQAIQSDHGALDAAMAALKAGGA